MGKQGGYTWKSVKYKIGDFGVIKAKKIIFQEGGNVNCH